MSPKHVVMTSLAVAALAFAPPLSPLATRRAAVTMFDSDVESDVPQVQLETVGSIVDFGDQLGIITEAEAKAKGGARYSVVTADEVVHSVKGNAIKCTFSPDKSMKSWKEVGAEAVLAPFEQVHSLAPEKMGIEPEDLELAWEFLSEEESNEFSARSIVKAIDEKLCKSSVDAYRAFRLLSSDLGHVFFKSLSGAKFKLKAAKAVQASKDAYCRQHDVEFCFV